MTPTDEWVDEDGWEDAPATPEPKPVPMQTYSAPEAYAQGAINGATLGFGDEIEGAGRALIHKVVPDSLGGSSDPIVDLYRRYRDSSRKDLATAEREHPRAAMAGGIVGGVIPAALTGGGSTLGSAVKTGGALGAAAGLGNSNADLTSGKSSADAMEAAGDTLIGGSLGAGLGAVGHGLGEAGSALASKAKQSANWLAASALKGTPGQYAQLSRQKLQEFGDWLLRNKFVRFGNSAENIGDKVIAAKPVMGQRVGDALSNLDQTGQKIPETELVSRMRDAANDLRTRGGPFADPAANRIDSTANRMVGRGDQTFSSAEEMKRYAQKLAYPSGRGVPIGQPLTAAQEGTRAAADAYKTAVEDYAEKVARQLGDDSLAQNFLNAKKDYGFLKTAEKMTGREDGRQLARNLLSPSDKIAALASAAHAGPLGLIAGPANKALRTRAASSLASTLDTASPLVGALSGQAENASRALTPEAVRDLIEKLRQ